MQAVHSQRVPRTMADVCERILALCQPSKVLTPAEMEQAHKLCTITEDFLAEGARDFIRRHRHDPIMIWYSADSTPLTTRQALTLDWDHLRVRRSGKASKDFMVQRCFMQAHDEMQVLFNAPRVLQDKTAWAAVQCWRDLVPLPSSRGHQGVCLMVIVADRALLSAVDRHIQQMLVAERTFLVSRLGEEVAHARSALQFYVPCACSSHDCHGGLRRALQEYCDDKTTLRNSWIVLESLRKSYDILLKGLLGWLRSVVVFEDWDVPWVGELWRLCQSDPRWVDQLIDLEARWSDGKLKISTRFERDEDIFDRLSAVFLQVWQFPAFSDSRWATLGPSMRSLLSSLLLGLEPFVEHCILNGCSKYYLNGFLRLDSQVKHFVGIASTCSFVSDTILASLLSDDRLALHIGEVDRAAQEELSYIFGLGQGVWDFVGQACGVSGGVLRSQSLRAGLVSLGYFNWRIDDIRKPPWTLCAGDLDANLDMVDQGDEPSHPFMRQLFLLLKSGYPREQLKDLLVLLGNASNSNLAGEQAHACAAVLRRKHPDYEVKSLQCRAQLLQMQPLLTEAAEERRIRRLEAKVERLSRKSPGHFTGRHALLQDLARVSKHLAQCGKEVGANEHQRIMRMHGSLWREMNEAQRHVWEREAHRRRAEMELEVQRELDDLLNDLDSARRRRQEEQERRHMHVGACRLSPMQKNMLNELSKSPKYSSASVKARRDDATREVSQPMPEFKAALDAIDITPSATPLPRPPWLAAVCRNRGMMKNCAFAWPIEGGQRLELFVFALENPLLAVFVKLEELDRETAQDYFATFPDLDFAYWRYTYKVIADTFAFTDTMAFDSVTPMVLPDCNLSREGFLTSDCKWLPLDSYLDTDLGHESVAPPESDASDTADETVEDQPWVDLPWLLDMMVCGAPSVTTPRRRPGAGRSRARARPERPGEEEVDMVEIMELLQEHREAAQCEGAPRPDFFVLLRGGAFTFRRSGVAYDCWRARAACGEPEEFSTRFGFGKTADFHISAYGEETAKTLADAWVHRTSFFYDQWVSSGRLETMDWSRANAAYVEPDALQHLAVGATAVLSRRLARLRDMRPR